MSNKRRPQPGKGHGNDPKTPPRTGSGGHKPGRHTAPHPKHVSTQSSGKSSGSTITQGNPQSRGQSQGQSQAPSRVQNRAQNEIARPDKRLWLYGHHAVEAALLNGQRGCLALRATKNAAEALSAPARDAITRRRLSMEIMTGDELAAVAPIGSVHQGILLAVEPLPALAFEDLPTVMNKEQPAIVVVLDQVTDPHNIGAILRSAAAFGAVAVVTQDRHAPPESGVIAKSASGALETIPWLRVVNLSRALDDLAQHGFWRIGLDGQADKRLDQIDLGARIVLILGAEGAGLRHGTAGHCDALAKLPITSAIESLNVSNAAAISLYEFARRIP